MAISIQSGETSRFTDLCDEPVDHLLSPIKDYEDKALIPLTEAIKPVCKFFNRIEDNAFLALHNCENRADGLTQQESASIQLYTMQLHGGPSLYLLLNQSLRAENRDELKPWFSFLKLFFTALYKLPSEKERVWCGVRNIDLSSKYKKGTKFAWWGVRSCTTDIQVLESNQFLGKHGLRTLFSIDCINGKSITNHSYFKNTEMEMILMPGSYFEVIGQLNPEPELHIIQLKEISPPITLVKPPFLRSSMKNTFSVMNKSNIYFQPKSKINTQNTPSKETSMKPNTKWKQFGVSIAGGNELGKKLDQLSFPQSIFIDDDDQTIYIADWWNDRIVEWKSKANTGQIVAGGNGKGNKSNQLNHPTAVIIDKENDSLIISDCENGRVIRWPRQNNTNEQIIISDIDCVSLTMDKNDSLYVSDCMKNEVKRWKRGETNGTIVAGGNGKGDNLNQLNYPTYLFIDEDHSLYVSDMNNHRVMKWLKDAKEGIVVAGGNSNGNRSVQLSYPEGVIVDRLGQIYVADSLNHRVMCWCKEGVEGTLVVGGNGQGNKSNQLNSPIDLSFDRQGNLYVVDCWNHRIQKFEIDIDENHLFH